MSKLLKQDSQETMERNEHADEISLAIKPK